MYVKSHLYTQLRMENDAPVFHRLPGETYSQSKERFETILKMVSPHMDKYYSSDTLRNVKGSDRTQIRNVKQRGVVAWPILEYWYNTYMPKEEVASS